MRARPQRWKGRLAARDVEVTHYRPRRIARVGGDFLPRPFSIRLLHLAIHNMAIYLKSFCALVLDFDSQSTIPIFAQLAIR